MKILDLVTIVSAMLLAPFAASAQSDEEIGLRNIDRAIAIADATWSKNMKGSDTNLYMADVYDTVDGSVSGPSDVWPLTAAIEAHCSILEAIEAARKVVPGVYEEESGIYSHRLELLIDNLEYYRGTYRLQSYASNREWSPYAVPRASKRGAANVTGILNVYDDQMWLSRELIRAYRLTGKKEYLELATYLADYVIDGWDCWRDADGNEYGGITWGPGYNSKHSCSNGPIIQPLVWLAEIYAGTGEEMVYYYRDVNNNAKKEMRDRSELYLEFAKKVYDWQKAKLGDGTGVYWDMMGAVKGEIEVYRGYRQHVDCHGPGGTFYSYNTGTMLGGGASLFKATGDAGVKADVEKTSKVALSKFARYVRKHGVYEFSTDKDALNGFNTWFNNVLMRAYVDAESVIENSSALNTFKAFQYNLDYAFDNHNRGDMLPIHLLDGWGDETKTKGFHQFTFVSQYALLGRRLFERSMSGIDSVAADKADSDDKVYTVEGIYKGRYDDMKDSLPCGIYVVGNRKIFVDK
ncbi:glycoside hydrolase family 76 protein [uncultured Muribaculum sp.]|uniref:glycoside hydrolase family 76 protein n=1 Tax=uncultured Muribaculum sp. TaxID=1918613 RepID=UPI0025D508D4|nr:glycoside hydrolase family 76 protein [uncultured Muribaculum sp.]